jgi:2-octaprenyl-6-methoxyphenol hydroxylase
MQSVKQNKEVEVIIVGGGVVGLTMAHALAIHNVTVAIIEKNEFTEQISDGRAFAISDGSKEILDCFGIWDVIKGTVGNINEIRVTDKDSLFFLHFDNKLIGSKPLGYMIESAIIHNALLNQVKENRKIEILAPATYSIVDYNANGVRVTLSDSTIINGKLLVAADGKNSKIRELLGIYAQKIDYGQTAIVCNIRHQKEHQAIAQERFLSAGPFAILPLKDPHISSIVWTERDKLAPLFAKMDREELNYHLAERFTDYLGKIEIVSKIFLYPISLTFSRKYYKDRAVLIGDSAHAIHPIAGQGYNLGLKDVKELVNLIIRNKKLGLDIGSSLLLKEYEDNRMFSNMAMIGITDSLNRLFSNNIAFLREIRSLGLAAVNKIPRLKKFFMEYAMGKEFKL